jgi:hypothetical protein
MSACPLCGWPTLSPEALCAHHSSSHEREWATGNRIMCDFLHRGIVLPTSPARPDLPLERLREPFAGSDRLDPRTAERSVGLPSIRERILRAVASAEYTTNQLHRTRGERPCGS